MNFLITRWRGIGTRLYMALAFAVALTLISSAVGVYYFERSGDLNHEAESESAPALEAAWTAAREAERLRVLGMGAIRGTDSAFQSVQQDHVEHTLERMERGLATAGSVPGLARTAQSAQTTAYDLVEVIDGLYLNRGARIDASTAENGLRARMARVTADTGTSAAGLQLLNSALQAQSQDELEGMWEEFTILTANGLEQEVTDIGGGDGVFAVRGQQLALQGQSRALAGSFEESSAALERSVSELLDGASRHNTETLGLAVQSFDEGRVLLAAISIISVIAATLAAWLWVGNAVVRRLSHLSERMRGMATGDLETPVPEVGRDEIGQLAEALEHFRQQALEVQRLNLVEKLYGELREANAELQRMQARLVAQEKLAALGELVSGVAHEISNPLNFVKNFSEGSMDLYQELTEMLDNYRDRMSEDDTSLLDELSGEITESLGRVSYNGGRALAIVERMRGINVEGGVLMMTDLNLTLSQAAQQACDTFSTEWEGFKVDLVFDLDDAVGDQMLSGRDFGEAVLNLASNACYAMYTKQGDQETGQENGYQPRLTVSSQVADGTVGVKVRDNGPGIPEDLLGRIFNPFFSTKDGALGAGLGLTLAADVARRMGGELTVDTEPGEYAEFTMHLPAAGNTEEREGAEETIDAV